MQKFLFGGAAVLWIATVPALACDNHHTGPGSCADTYNQSNIRIHNEALEAVKRNEALARAQWESEQRIKAMRSGGQVAAPAPRPTAANPPPSATSDGDECRLYPSMCAAYGPSR